MTTDLQPLRLAVGSHKRGSGKGCAMNVVSWENGDTTITDMPGCADPMLARVVQRVNDQICTHRDRDLLCPKCSVVVLDLAHRTVGTNLAARGWKPVEIHRVWVRLAVAEAESVQHLAKDPVKAAERIGLAKAWVETGTKPAASAYAAAAAAYASAASYAAYASASADAAAAAAAAADAASSAAASAAASYAAYADAYAASSAAAYADARLRRAHHVIDRFEDLTGVRSTPTPAKTTARARAAMLGTAAAV